MLLRHIIDYLKSVNWMAAALLCASLGVIGCANKAQPVELLIENVTIYRGDSSPAFVGSIAVRDGKFAAVTTPGDTDFEAQKKINGSGMFVTPGLWDAHVHMRSSIDDGLDASSFLRFGVTSIHDLGGYLDRIKELEAQLLTNPNQGPHIYPVYYMLNGESFAGYQHSVTTETEAAEAIDELVSAGAVQIKVHRALSPDLAPFVFDEAHRRGLKVTGHIPLGMHPKDACEAGMDSVEHLGSFIEAFVSVAPVDLKNSLAGLDYMQSDASDPLIDCLVSNGVVVTPTLIIYPSIAKKRSEGTEIPQRFLDFIQKTNSIAKRLHDAGVILLAGTDTSDFEDAATAQSGAALLEELQIMERTGIEPAAIIQIATLNSARAIGVDSTTGSIDVSKDADFLILRSDPGQTVSNLASIAAVYKGGRRVYVAPD